MEANELRIGNRITRKSNGNICHVSWGVIKDVEDGYSDYIPITLTEEWLIRMGFVSDRNGYNLPNTKFSLTEQLYPCWLDRILWPQDISDFKGLSIKHVHQLQNLYFSLTGKELEIK